MPHPNDKIYNRIEPEDPVTSADFLKQILDRYHIDFNNPARHIISQWKELAGPAIGNYSECVGYSKGVIEVVCSHPAYLQLVKMSKKEILKNVNSVFPELKVTDMRVSVKTTDT